MNTPVFNKEEIISIFSDILDKTLGEIDKNGVFNKARSNPKITGIAGDVIEQSVLGYPANNSKSPDLDIDGIKTELKTTGFRKNNKNEYSAKEPMSITGVAPKTIITEDFANSAFFAKIEHTLFVYYHYESKKTVTAAEYSKFHVRGFELHNFDNKDLTRLESDWTIVKNFILSVQNLPDPTTMYPQISKLRNKMIYLDTAPKWPNHPRFRFKRSFVDSIIKEYFGHKNEEVKGVSTYEDVDRICNEFTKKYKGMPLKEIASQFSFIPKGKNTSEQVITSMFGTKTKKITNIELFSKAGILSKTIVLNPKGGRTEDMKMMRIFFDEIEDSSIEFENSSFYDYFAEHQFLCVILSESKKDSPLEDNIFQGFKRFSFDDDFIESTVRKAWDHTRKLVRTKTLIDVISKNKLGQPIINKTGIVKSAPNFIKKKDNSVFIRGDSSNSTRKPEIVNGISMYNQYVWISGEYIVNAIREIQFL